VGTGEWTLCVLVVFHVERGEELGLLKFEK
jgi:hypothetical protein